ncbi:HNH endonuclease signature motif containing protein [Ancylobacter oerskovii]|uniref:HNH endonuclease signature motif containing protein n=1 Tax=Ancylobacter oerskovii TaxID=459519 RepID=A0ABW4Z179_9HYPH|nr:HNH endonuclease signature motif containing protein [Ancylobacter oerskovii]MBS7545076.1 HNH endonuclease [Ancylobacter oerskovii]
MTDVEARLRVKFIADPDTGCWNWHGAKQPTGYGTLWNGRRPEQAHRISYRLFCGEIGEGNEIDHICRNRGCINPEHLRAVPHRENMRVSNTAMGRNAAKLFCKRGHPFEGSNLIITPRGARQCRACVNMLARKYKARKRANG